VEVQANVVATQDSIYLETEREKSRFLRARFQRRGDRYAHRVVLCDRDNEICLLDSVEGDHHERWPPSPPLQQISGEQLPDGRKVVLLVGMAGRSHWSLSATTTPDRKALVFEVACRAVESPERLCSQYQTPGNPYDIRGEQLSLADATLSIDTSSAGTADLAVDQQRISVRRQLDSLPLPATFCWTYRMGLIRS
jgi:hypothetical protein